jgi:hypothetical protein
MVIFLCGDSSNGLFDFPLQHVWGLGNLYIIGTLQGYEKVL